MNEINIKEYLKYKVTEISELKFSYENYIEVKERFKKSKFFEIQNVGKSFENRDIFLFKVGTGKIKIFAWSQMHGNEPVSSMAMLDFMNFLMIKKNECSFIENCSFYFMPMVNPDGAEKFVRRNSQGIDLNRDALKMTAPESKILNDIIDKIHPDFAFNLHDQERYYGTENCENPTIMSFLAPSFDINKTIDLKRENSMRVISNVYIELKKHLKKGIAKYNDSFMPNAFGDNVQKKNISTILFEGGYIVGDEQRQDVRRYYFLSLFFATKSISENDYKNVDLSIYSKIPMNIKYKFVDIIIRDIVIFRKGKKFVTDIAISKNILDTEQFTDTKNDYIIIDIGDLRGKLAFKEINLYKKNEFIDDEFRIKRLNDAYFLLDYFNIK